MGYLLLLLQTYDYLSYHMFVLFSTEIVEACAKITGAFKLDHSIPTIFFIYFRLRKIIQHGLSAHVLDSWYPPRSRCPETYSSKPTAVKFEQFLPAIFLLLMGMSVSAFLLCIEHFYYYRTEASQEQERSVQTPDPTPVQYTQEY